MKEMAQDEEYLAKEPDFSAKIAELEKWRTN
jgi:hypothetical protein